MQDTTPKDDALRAYLSRIEESKFLGRSVRRSALLAYLVECETTGQGEKIKAYSIGLDVFGKPKDFDPSADSSVRVEVGRLRAAIAKFEASEWADTDIKVDIPVGTYRPVITQRAIDPGARPKVLSGDVAEQVAPKMQRANGYMGLAAMMVLVAVVLAGFFTLAWRETTTASGPPIKLTVEELGDGALGKQMALLVKDSFSNNAIIELQANGSERVGDGYFLVSGDVAMFNDAPYVSVELTNQDTQELVWSHFFLLDENADLREELDNKLNGELETRLIGEAKIVLEQRDVTLLTPEQLFILGTWVSGPAVGTMQWESERVDLMKLALAQDPDFGPAHSVLADKYGFLANVHPDWDTEENLQLSKYHAERAVALSPLDANTMFNVAQSFWHTGRHADSERIFRRVTELDQSNTLARFFARLMPYWCADVPDDTMRWALEFDANLSRDDPIRWIVLTWIATLHTNRREYKEALRAITDAAEIFQVGYTYMAHAMLLAKAGQPDAAREIIRRQKANWPGIQAEHYANSTVPRLCSEQPGADGFINDYKDLAKVLGTE